MPEFDFNLAVIGSGPAGEKGACQVAYFGLDDSIVPESCRPRTKADFRVAIIEQADDPGGACTNTGTLPSKTLRESALFLSGARARQLSGGDDAGRAHDITVATFMRRAHEIQARERARISQNLDRHRITRIAGRATLVDPHGVEIALAGGGVRRVSAEIILVATGSTPSRPAFIPFNRDNVFDCDTVLQMARLPRSMIVVGGGVIGCEYACLFNALGLAVSLVNRSDHVLDFLDREIVVAFVDGARRAGLEFVFDEEIESCRAAPNEVTAQFRSGRELRAESLLYAAGRGGNTTGLGLEALGIRLGRYGNIEDVDPVTYQTTVPSIYAAGDVIGRPALASTSMEQGRLAMCHAFNIRYRGQELNPILPSGIYTIPEISSVGDTEEQLDAANDQRREAGHPIREYVVGRSRFSDHLRGHLVGDTCGLVKLIFSAPEGRLLGCHVIGENACELVHFGLACLQFNADITSVINTVFNYPTLSIAYQYAAYDALGKLNATRSGQRAEGKGQKEVS
jgi:NAD(P) transhydrogenase